VKPLDFLVNSLERVQHGKPATDFKPMLSVGQGIEELPVWEVPARIGASISRGSLPRSASFFGVRCW
jgi:hypothetical protein